MDINSLTIGEAKELVNIFCKTGIAEKSPDLFVGKYVICRCYSAGVHAGFFVSQNDDVVVLKDSRRLWSWKAKEGVALSGVASNGLADGCKVDSMVSLIRLTGVIETIACSEKVKVSIDV
jgi:hypothetical protein